VTERNGPSIQQNLTPFFSDKLKPKDNIKPQEGSYAILNQGKVVIGLCFDSTSLCLSLPPLFALSLSLSLSLSHTHTQTHTLSLSRSRARALTHTHSHSLSLYTHTQTDAHMIYRA
jgi:hypothetical protein